MINNHDVFRFFDLMFSSDNFDGNDDTQIMLMI